MSLPESKGQSLVTIAYAKQTAGSGKWLALAAALLGWMFDGMEMGIFSMVGRPAVRNL